MTDTTAETPETRAALIIHTFALGALLKDYPNVLSALQWMIASEIRDAKKVSWGNALDRAAQIANGERTPATPRTYTHESQARNDTVDRIVDRIQELSGRSPALELTETDRLISLKRELAEANQYRERLRVELAKVTHAMTISGLGNLALAIEDAIKEARAGSVTSRQ